MSFPASVPARFFERFLRARFRVGSLAVTLPGGRRVQLGDGSDPTVEASIRDRASLARILARPTLGAGEAYMEGALTLERGTIRDLIGLAARNPAGHGGRPSRLARAWARLARERNAKRTARKNVHHHYDLSLELYRRFLDSDLQYSCAYFARDDMSLEEAQEAKKRHIAAKLLLRPGQKVLDIGCGWGGLALTLAAEAQVEVDGITLSAEQLKVARQRALAAGLAERARFSLTDYRDARGTYDRIVSVGMFEHVGRPNYDRFFRRLADRLAPDGIALVHAIGRFDGPSTTDPFTAKYIFPGGYIPALSEVLPSIERAGLRVTDLEVLRRHYAETLRCWSERFALRRAEIARLYDERFCRMWEFYLAGAEMGFRYGSHMVFQIQMTRSGEAAPITRDYIGEAERRLAGPPTLRKRERAAAA